MPAVVALGARDVVPVAAFGLGGAEHAFGLHDLVLHEAGEAFGEPGVAATKIGQHQMTEFMGGGPVVAEGLERKARVNVEIHTLGLTPPRLRPGHRLVRGGLAVDMHVHRQRQRTHVGFQRRKAL